MNTKIKELLQLASYYNTTLCPHCGEQHHITICPHTDNERYKVLYSPDICEKGLEDLRAEIRRIELQPIVDFIKVIK